jgi:hypothetical protein
LAKALQELEKQQQRQESEPRPAPEAEETRDEDAARRRARQQQEAERQKSRDEIEGAVEAIRERQVAERVPVRRARFGPARWIALGAIAAGVIVLAAILLRPEPLPPPATSAQAAVRGFWDAIGRGHYQGATVYYPALIENYGSRKQAALHLKQMFGDDPPVKVSVGPPEELADSDDLRVGYEVWRRSGMPRKGEFIVRDSGSATGYVIVYSS